MSRFRKGADQTAARAVQRRRAEVEATPMSEERRQAEHRHLDQVEHHRVLEAQRRPENREWI